MPIVSLYAGLLGMLFVGLSVRTLLLRRRLKIAVGDGGNEVLQRAIRVHSNFAEYVPFSLFLTFLVAQTGAGPHVLHRLGLTLLIGRVVHAYGVSQVRERFAFRIVGMALTLTAIVGASIRLVSFALHARGG